MNIPDAMGKRIYAANHEQWKDVCAVSRRSERTLEVRELTGGILLPPIPKDDNTGEYSGGVCDSGFHFVAGLFREKPPGGGCFGVNAAYSLEEGEVLFHKDEDIIYGGVLIGHFGHFILECFGRMWYILRNRESQKRIAFLSVMGTAGWFDAFFSLLDIPPDRILLVDTPTQFRSVTIPEEAVHSWYDYTEEYLLPYRYMANRASISPGARGYLYRRLFLTRSRLFSTETVCCNEAYFARFYAGKGFSVIAPEDFSVEEQIAIFSHAREVVCVLGTLSHWALFCKPGTKFTMLARTNNETLGSQCLVNEASGVDWRIVDVSMNFLHATRSFGVCLIGPTPYWKQFVRDHYGVFEEDESWKYSYHEYLSLWADFYLNNQMERLKRMDFVQVVREMQAALGRNEVPERLQEGKRPHLFVCARLRGRGWLPPVTEGEICGDEEGPAALDAVKIYFAEPYYSIHYRVYSEGIGWGHFVSGNQTAEIMDEHEQPGEVYGLAIRLDENRGHRLFLQYRIRALQCDWSGWFDEGAALFSGTAPIHAFEVRLVEQESPS